MNKPPVVYRLESQREPNAAWEPLMPWPSFHGLRVMRGDEVVWQWTKQGAIGTKRGGEWANATKATTPYLHWREVVIEASGASHEWAREPEQRGHLNRAYDAGEPVWMAADMLAQRWAGKITADREARHA